MTGQHRPLVVTADAELLDDVLGVAAAVGVAVDVAVDPGACGALWTTAPLVVVGGDVAATLAGAALLARPGVLLASRDVAEDDEQVGMALRPDDVVRLPSGESILSERLADAVEPSGGGRVIAVLPGRGGAGASVLAAALALTAADGGHGAWLVDLDPLGGGADAVLGAELAAGARWDDLDSLAGRVSTRALRDALPVTEGVAVLSSGDRAADPAPAAVRTVLGAARRGGGTVVVDLPRRPGPSLREALSAADEVLLLVPADVRAVLAARQLVGRIGDLTAPLRVVVRRMPQGLPPQEVVRALRTDLLDDYTDETPVRAALLGGDPRGLIDDTDLGALCRRILAGPAAWARTA